MRHIAPLTTSDSRCKYRPAGGVLNASVAGPSARGFRAVGSHTLLVVNTPVFAHQPCARSLPAPAWDCGLVALRPLHHMSRLIFVGLVALSTADEVSPIDLNWASLSSIQTPDQSEDDETAGRARSISAVGANGNRKPFATTAENFPRLAPFSLARLLSFQCVWRGPPCDVTLRSLSHRGRCCDSGIARQRSIRITILVVIVKARDLRLTTSESRAIL
jgi:hypothetical protein